MATTNVPVHAGLFKPYPIDFSGKLLGITQSRTLTDSHGNVTGHIETSSWTDGQTSNSHTYHYDANWNLTGSTNTWGYDDGYGNTSTHTETRDAGGNLVSSSDTWSHDDGYGFTSTHTRTYDAGSNLTTWSDSDSSGYQASGSSRTLTDSHGNVTGHIETSSWTDGQTSNSYTYHYDANWNLTGSTNTWGYDDGNGNTSTHTETRDAGGNLVSSSDTWTHDDGYGFTSTHTRTYDAGSNLTTWSDSDSSGYQASGSSRTLTDSHGNVTGHIETSSWTDGTSSNSFSYNYDANWNFLGGESTYNGITTTYDSNWNVISEVVNDTTETSPLLVLEGYSTGDTINLTAFTDESTDVLYGLDFCQFGSITTTQSDSDTFVRVDLDGVIDETADFATIQLVGYSGEISVNDFIVA